MFGRIEWGISQDSTKKSEHLLMQRNRKPVSRAYITFPEWPAEETALKTLRGRFDRPDRPYRMKGTQLTMTSASRVLHPEPRRSAHGEGAGGLGVTTLTLASRPARVGGHVTIPTLSSPYEPGSSPGFDAHQLAQASPLAGSEPGRHQPGERTPHPLQPEHRRPQRRHDRTQAEVGQPQPDRPPRTATSGPAARRAPSAKSPAARATSTSPTNPSAGSSPTASRLPKPSGPRRCKASTPSSINHWSVTCDFVTAAQAAQGHGYALK